MKRPFTKRTIKNYVIWAGHKVILPTGYKQLKLGSKIHKGDKFVLGGNWSNTGSAGDIYIDPTMIYCTLLKP